MSQHNIVGSEVFGPRPLTVVKSPHASGGLRRRRPVRLLAVAFVTGAAVALAGGAVALAAVFGPTLFG